MAYVLYGRVPYTNCPMPKRVLLKGVTTIGAVGARHRGPRPPGAH